MAERLAKLAKFIETNQCKENQFPKNCEHSLVRRVDDIGNKRWFYRVVPLSEKPAIDPFIVHWGGGRTLGGGFSKDAQRRAKRQEKTNK